MPPRELPGAALDPAPLDPTCARQLLMVSLQLNGEPVSAAVPAHWTLLEALRYALGATGSKQGCDKGDCGACTVLVGGKPVLSCLTLAAAVQGKAVETVEGLGVGGEPHPLQQAFAQLGAAQCGFCTPGMLMSASAYLDRLALQDDPQVSRHEIAAALGGNLCRCTGYTKIIDAVAQVAGQTVARAREFNEQPGGDASAEDL